MGEYRGSMLLKNPIRIDTSHLNNGLPSSRDQPLFTSAEALNALRAFHRLGFSCCMLSSVDKARFPLLSTLATFTETLALSSSMCFFKCDSGQTLVTPWMIPSIRFRRKLPKI